MPTKRAVRVDRAAHSRGEFVSLPRFGQKGEGARRVDGLHRRFELGECRDEHADHIGPAPTCLDEQLDAVATGHALISNQNSDLALLEGRNSLMRISHRDYFELRLERIGQRVCNCRVVINDEDYRAADVAIGVKFVASRRPGASHMPSDIAKAYVAVRCVRVWKAGTVPTLVVARAAATVGRSCA